MLTCTPKSICSWNFQIYGTTPRPADVTFNFMTEQGSISLGRMEFSVRKHGWLSGHWSLEHGGAAYADARKPSALFRAFEISCGPAQHTVKAQSTFTRCFNILTNNRVVGTIQPVHAFTRRAVIECDASVPETTQLFAFWLAVLTWKRAADSNNS